MQRLSSAQLESTAKRYLEASVVGGKTKLYMLIDSNPQKLMEYLFHCIGLRTPERVESIFFSVGLPNPPWFCIFPVLSFAAPFGTVPEASESTGKIMVKVKDLNLNWELEEVVAFCFEFRCKRKRSRSNGVFHQCDRGREEKSLQPTNR